MMKRNSTLTFALLALFSIYQMALHAESPDEIFLADVNAIEEKVAGNTYEKWDYFIYPVPVSDILNIKITKGDVKIENIVIKDENGAEIMKFANQYSDKIKLNLESLQPGTYFINIDSDTYELSKMKRFYIVP
jgi:hypothetical protein